MMYVSQDVKCLHLSYQTMLELCIINKDFPSVRQFNNSPATEPFCLEPTSQNQFNRSTAGICGATQDSGAICNCPQKDMVSERPSSLSFKCDPKNNEIMKDWLLRRYESSTLNTCPHQRLPEMSGPPVEIHIKEGVQPLACHTPVAIPIHWQDQVRSDLEKDEALGVIECVLMGESVDWCHRMVVTRKQDGSSHHSVDLSLLNKHCKRETHNSESPFHQAR